MKTLILMITTILSLSVVAQEVTKEESLGGLTLVEKTISIDWIKVSQNLVADDYYNLSYSINIEGSTNSVFNEEIDYDTQRKIQFAVEKLEKEKGCYARFETTKWERTSPSVIAIEISTRKDITEDKSALKECAIEGIMLLRETIGNEISLYSIVLEDKSSNDNGLNDSLRSNEDVREQISNNIKIPVQVSQK